MQRRGGALPANVFAGAVMSAGHQVRPATPNTSCDPIIRFRSDAGREPPEIRAARSKDAHAASQRVQLGAGNRRITLAT